MMSAEPSIVDEMAKKIMEYLEGLDGEEISYFDLADKLGFHNILVYSLLRSMRANGYPVEKIIRKRDSREYWRWSTPWICPVCGALVSEWWNADHSGTVKLCMNDDTHEVPQKKQAP